MEGTAGKVAAIMPVFNEAHRIGALLERFDPGLVDMVLAVDDGSTDGSAKAISRCGLATVLEHGKRRGVGAALRTGIRHAAASGCDTVVIMAGNGKDDPREIPVLLEPIRQGEADYVQGSRYLPGGLRTNTPVERLVSTRLFTFAWSVLMGRRLTDASNGFRAYRTSLFEDPRIDIEQDWLDRYQFEYYLHYKVLALGYRFREVAVSKVYPKGRRSSYSKIRPGRDWWEIVAPLPALKLGLRK